MRGLTSCLRLVRPCLRLVRPPLSLSLPPPSYLLYICISVYLCLCAYIYLLDCAFVSAMAICCTAVLLPVSHSLLQQQLQQQQQHVDGGTGQQYEDPAGAMAASYGQWATGR